MYVFRGSVLPSFRNYVNVLIQRWSTKSETVKSISKMQDDRPSTYAIKIRCHSKRRIINNGANCWLNSILQILCGSALKTLLSLELSGQLSVMKDITRLQNELQKEDKPIPTRPLVPEIAKSIGMPLEKMLQEDASEGYISILTQLFSDSDEHALFVKDNFTNTKSNLTICLRCQNMSGIQEQEFVTVLDTIRCKPIDVVSTSDLIWNECFRKYELNDKCFWPKCGVAATHDKLLLASFFLYRQDLAVFHD